jgi:hypothetical protein
VRSLLGAALLSEQLKLFVESPNGAEMTAAEVGPTDHCPPGAERLLAALMKRSLHEGDLRVAAALCLALDERASG